MDNKGVLDWYASWNEIHKLAETKFKDGENDIMVIGAPNPKFSK